MNSDYRQIVAFLRGVRRLRWAAAATEALLKAAVVAVVVLTMNVFVVHGRTEWLWLFYSLALAGTGAVYAALAVAAAAFLRRASMSETGKVVQKGQSEFRDDVVTCLEVGELVDGEVVPEHFSLPLASALLATTRDSLGGLRTSRFVSWRGAGRWGLRLALVLLPMALFYAAGGSIAVGPVRALVDPTVYWPLSQVRFAVVPGTIRIVAGSDLEISARLSGRSSATAFIVVDGPGEEYRRPMTVDGEGSFRTSISRVQHPIRYRVSAAASASPWYDVSVVPPPRPGSFEVELTYPAYTGLPERKAASNGNLEVLPGTEARITFATTSVLSEGKLLLGDTVYDVFPVGGGRYGVTVVCAGEKYYSLALTDREGFADPEPQEYRIDYIADEMPQVEILEPRGETVLGVFLQIPIRFRSSDDFGLSRIALVHRTPSGGEKSEQMPLGKAARTVEGEYLWDGSVVEAPAGSRVEVFLEVRDNDTVNGPKVARSSSFTLLVPDVEEEHRKSAALLEDLIEKLVDSLADELDLLGRYEDQESDADEWEEFPWNEFEETENLRQSLEEKAPDLMETVAALQQQMATDPLSRPESFFQLERIAREMENMNLTSREPRGDVARSIDRSDVHQEEMQQKTRFKERYTAEAVEALEQMVLQAEEMQRERNMADIRDSGSDMLDLQEEILAGLENLEQGDSQGMEELMADLASLEKMLQELMEALNRENELLPDEFLNSDALEELPVSDLMKGLQDIRRRLAAGDLEGARQAAREMLRDIADLMNRLQQAGEEFRQQSRQALNRLKNSTIPELERMIAEQKKILEETESLDGQIQARQPEGEEERDGETSHMMFEGEKQEMAQLADEEGALSEDAASLADEAAALKEVLPFLDPSVENDLRGSAGEMEDASSQLAGSSPGGGSPGGGSPGGDSPGGGSPGGGSPGGAIPSERTALSLLMKARDGARQSLQALEQMQGLREGQGGMGFFPSPGSGRSGSAMPQRGEDMGGRRGVSVRSFRLPGKEDYSVPPLFRQEILKSLREGYPEGYEGRIRDYFHRITE